MCRASVVLMICFHHPSHCRTSSRMHTCPRSSRRIRDKPWHLIVLSSTPELEPAPAQGRMLAQARLLALVRVSAVVLLFVSQPGVEAAVVEPVVGPQEEQPSSLSVPELLPARQSVRVSIHSPRERRPRAQ